MEKIKTHNLVLGVMTSGLIIAPILCKLMMNELLGPAFNFYFFICWIPIVSIGIATVRGWRESALTGILIVIALLISMVSYPHDPPMDFHRQIVHQGDMAIVVAALVSLALQVYLKRRKISHGY